MKVNLGLAAHNSKDWDRVLANDFSHRAETPDFDVVDKVMSIGDLAEPLGFDGIWVGEHFGIPYGMSPNSLQVLAYFAGRTERVSLGTMLVIAPWWNPIRLAHQIAYLDIVSKGRYDTIGLGRGVAKTEFDAMGVPREESMARLAETIDILELAFTKERFSYEGKIFKIPEVSIRPQPRSRDLFSRLYGGSVTGPTLEMISRRGLKPLLVGNKPLTDAIKDVQKVNTFRHEVGLPPCQPKNILFMYCTRTKEEARAAEEYVTAANRDVALAYGLNDASNFVGVKGYETYAARISGAAKDDKSLRTAMVVNQPTLGTGPGKASAYDESVLLIGTPEDIIQKIAKSQSVCSFSEITIQPHIGTMPLEETERSVRLFAREVLPVVHNMSAPMHAAALPETAAAGG